VTCATITESDPSRNGFAEGRQLDRIQSCPVSRHLSQGEMRVGGGIAMPQESVSPWSAYRWRAPANVSSGQISNLLRIFPKRACVDDGFAGLELTSASGKEVPLDSDGSGLLGHNTAKASA